MYERDVLEGYEERKKLSYPAVEAAMGLTVTDRATGFGGEIVEMTAEAVTLRSKASGDERLFRWKVGGFALRGRAVTLGRPKNHVGSGPSFSNSGSVVGVPRSAQVASGSRIWVEGKHDAELVEHVWGDDLRELAIVVEPMHGLDDLADAVLSFSPSANRRLGVLVDHLVPGSKEARIAASVGHQHVLVAGHPFVDVWAAIWPRTVGLDRWPDVPRGQPWKEGICAALGVPSDGFWPKLRNSVKTYADLRPELVGAVEQLIDFVQPDPA